MGVVCGCLGGTAFSLPCTACARCQSAPWAMMCHGAQVCRLNRVAAVTSAAAKQVSGYTDILLYAQKVLIHLMLIWALRLGRLLRTRRLQLSLGSALC